MRQKKELVPGIRIKFQQVLRNLVANFYFDFGNPRATNFVTTKRIREWLGEFQPHKAST